MILMVRAQAIEVELSGHVEGQVRWFQSSPKIALTQKQSMGSMSFAFEPKWKYLTRDRRHDFKISPFIRYDAEDKERTHVDIRELYWLYKGNEWEILAGINQVFWGVTESRHLVDIINQTDLVEDLDEEDKLGQPMIRLTRELKLAQASQQQDLGKLTLFLMPGFRERTFPGPKARLRTPFPVDQDTARFPGGASKDRIDLALRYSHTIGDWDIGLHYFHGNSREPLLIPNPARGLLIPQYDLINQVGADIQYTSDAWLGKFEGIIRGGQGKTFGALVAGIEYTNYQIFESNADLGLLVEYLHDDRDENFAPKTIFDNDIFLGTRLSLNDIQNTQVLAGIVSDMETNEYSFSLEAERRINNNIKLELLIRAFGASDPKDTLASVEEDDYAQLSVFYHF